MYRNVVGQLLGGSTHLDEHAIHTAAALHVHIGIQKVSGCCFKAHNVTNLNSFLEQDLEVVELC